MERLRKDEGAALNPLKAVQLWNLFRILRF
jgi:hypothetical protein